MNTVSRRVEEWVYHHPRYIPLLADGLINLSAFARHIHPYLEHQTANPVSIDAVTLALHRMVKKIPRTTSLPQNFDDVEISLQTDVALIYFPIKNIHAEAFSKAIAILHKTNEYALYSKSTASIALLAKPPIIKELSVHFNYSDRQYDLTAISLRTKDKKFSPALHEHIFQNISTPIHEVFSSRGSMTLVIDQDDTPTVIDSLSRVRQ